MSALNRWIWASFLVFGFCDCVHSFTGAPGFLTLKVQTPQFVEDCIQKNCKYDLEICIGSGRTSDEKCLWSQHRDFDKNFDMNKKYLAEIHFQVDDVQSSFYFNANLSYVQNKNILKTERFRDVMFKYSESQTLYSTEFTTLAIEIFIKCKPGFYPKLKCTVPCFNNLPVYKCNELGEKICLKGYSFVASSNECVLDNCSLEKNVCQNNGTCINDIHGTKCLCPYEYTGTSCNKWDPCLKHKCQNGGRCTISHFKRAYVCLCVGNYFGMFCEHFENPCLLLKCNQDSRCIITENEPKCVKLKRHFIQRTPTTVSTSSSRTSIVKEKNHMVMEKVQIEKETVRLVQYHPFKNEYTTFSIVIVVSVFMIGSFSVAFWILKLKYSKNKNKSYRNFNTLPVMPSIFNTTSYRSGDDNIRRCYSLDDNSFFMYNQPQSDIYHTYRSGSHVWSKDPRPDTYRDNYGSLNPPHRMCHSMMRTRMPVLCEPNTNDSCDLNFNVANDSQTNSEKIDDFNNNYLGTDEPSIIDV